MCAQSEYIYWSHIGKGLVHTYMQMGLDCTSTYIHACIRTQLPTYIPIRESFYTHTWNCITHRIVSKHKRRCTHKCCMHEWFHRSMHAYIHYWLLQHTHSHTYAYVHTCKYAYIHAYIHAYVRTFTHIYSHETFIHSTYHILLTPVVNTIDVNGIHIRIHIITHAFIDTAPLCMRVHTYTTHICISTLSHSNKQIHYVQKIVLRKETTTFDK